MRSIFTILSVIVGILLSSASFSQTVSQSWYRQINVPQNQSGPVMARDNSGNVYLAATIVQNSTGWFYIMKYNSSGTQVWAVTYAGTFPGGVNVTAIAVDAASNIIVSANGTDATGHGAIQTVKYNSAGAQIWSIATQVGLQYSSVTAITTDPAGNVFLAGRVVDNTNYPDFLVVKLNVDGVQQWVGKYNGSAFAADFATAVTADASGNVYVTGSSQGQIIGRGTRTPTGSDYVTIKYDPSGVVQWINRYYTTADDQPSALVVDASGNVYVTGYTNGNVGTTVAYSSTGTQLWVSQPPGAKFNKSIAKDASGNIFVSGFAGMTNGQFTYYTTKFSAAGTVLWTQSYNGGPIFYLDPKTYLAIDGSGNAYVTVPIAGSASNIATIKYSSSGIQSWVAIFNGPANVQDFATGLLTYQSSSPVGGVSYPSVYVCGMSDWQSNSSPGYVTLIKYTQSATAGSKALAQTSTDAQSHTAGQLEATSTFGLSNYPNPYKGATYITYNLPYDSHVLIQVFDAAGRAVAVPVNEHQPAGFHTQPFQSGRLSRGTYSYRILATSGEGTLTETKQMILQ